MFFKQFLKDLLFIVMIFVLMFIALLNFSLEPIEKNDNMLFVHL